MQYLPFALLALACPLGMGLMMLFMGRGMMGMGKKDDGHSETSVGAASGFVQSDDPGKRLAVLQAQRELIDGVYKLDGKLLLVLNTDRVLQMQPLGASL